MSTTVTGVAASMAGLMVTPRPPSPKYKQTVTQRIVAAALEAASVAHPEAHVATELDFAHNKTVIRAYDTILRVGGADIEKIAGDGHGIDTYTNAYNFWCAFLDQAKERANKNPAL